MPILSNFLMEKLFEARERKAEVINNLIKKYKMSLVILSLNIPGINKNKELYNKFLSLINEKLINEFSDNLFESKKMFSFAGNYYYYLLSVEAGILKNKMIIIEETDNVGRILDIDVFNKEGKLIKRSHLNYERRRCLLCNDDALVCRRLNRHSQNEVLEKIDNLIITYLEKRS